MNILNIVIHPSHWHYHYYHWYYHRKSHPIEKGKRLVEFMSDTGLTLLIMPIIVGYLSLFLLPVSTVSIFHIPRPPAYEIKYEKMAAKLRIGMPLAAVRNLFGEPTIVRGSYDGLPTYGYCIWLYAVDKDFQLRIRVNDNDTVKTWNMALKCESR